MSIQLPHQGISQHNPHDNDAVERPREQADLAFISTDNREHEYQRALKHTSKVRFWKIVLPVLGGLTILGIVAAMLLRSYSLPEVSVENINLSDGKLVMENPKLNGYDGDERPYNLTAAKAVQNVNTPSQVELHELLAELPMDETTSATITAGNGLYDADAKTLILTEAVNIVTSSGIVMNMQDADVDIGNSTMKTDNPISATSLQADISSQSMAVEDGGNRLIFKGRVRMTIRPDELRNTSEKSE